MRLEAWLEEVAVEREKGIDEELVKRSCVGSAEWLFRSRAGGFIHSCVACCSQPRRGSLHHRLPLEWATNDLSRHDGGYAGKRWPVKRGHQAALLQCLRGLNTLRAVLLISVFIGIQSGLARFSIFTFHSHSHSQSHRSLLPLRAPSARPLLPPIIARRQQFPLLSPTASLL
jgi:hypothetical protein